MKHFIKRSITVAALLMFIITFSNCNTDITGYTVGEEIQITETLPEGGNYDAEIQNLKSVSGEREITITWDATLDKNLGYYIVEWTGQGSADATSYTQSVSKDAKKYTLKNLYNESYKITVKCASKDFITSKGVNITATPEFDTTAPNAVSNISTVPLAISASIKWVNPTATDFFKIILTITDKESLAKKIVELPAYMTSYQAIDLEEMSEYDVTIETYDYIGNKSSTAVTFKTLRETLLLNKNWTLADFSQEEASGEGATGRAKDAFDDNDATYWHSPWTGGGSSLPQFIVIDLNQEVIPTTLISFKRNNNNNGPTSVRIEGSLDNKEWFNFGTFPLAKDNNAGQNCNLTNTQKIRYIKYTVLSSPNNYAMVRNIKIRALISE